MKAYSVSYDLLKPGQDYSKLIAELQRLNAMKILLSEWLVLTEMSAAEVRDRLLPFLDQNDRIFVAGLTGEAAWRNVIAPGDDVKKRLAA